MKIESHGEITEKAFQEAVTRKRKTGLSFILAIYQTLDEFLEKEIKESGVTLACKKGCSLCCYQIVTCTEMEVDEIVRFIKEMPRTLRRPLEKRLKKFAIKWQNYYRRNEVTLKANPFPFKLIMDWRGKPCPFLNKTGEFCDVYPVRIIDCRTATSLTSCNTTQEKPLTPCPVDYEGPGRFRFQSEKLANNMILDEQKRFGPMAVTPVHHWLLVKKF